MTTDQLVTTYQRAMQYCVAKYGSEPEKLSINEYGSMEAQWSHYAGGGFHDYTYEEFTIENLTEDLDSVYADRKQKEEERYRQQQDENKKRQERELEQAKEKRKSDYLKLKAEFE